MDFRFEGGYESRSKVHQLELRSARLNTVHCHVFYANILRLPKKKCIQGLNGGVLVKQI